MSKIGYEISGEVGFLSTGGYEQCSPVYRAIISGATSGDNTVVAAVTGKKIRVLSYVLAGAGAVTVRFESGAGGTALTGVMSLVANGNLSLAAPYNPHGHFETAAATLLNMELGGAVQVSGHITYILVD